MSTFELHAKKKMFPGEETETKIQKLTKDMRITRSFASAGATNISSSSLLLSASYLPAGRQFRPAEHG